MFMKLCTFLEGHDYKKWVAHSHYVQDIFLILFNLVQVQLNKHIDDKGLMSGKEPWEMDSYRIFMNAQVDSEILDTFLIVAVESRFADDEVIPQDDNWSTHRANVSSGNTHQLSVVADKLNLTENVQKVKDKAASCNADL